MKKPPEPVFITFNGEDVIVSEVYQACAQGDRCIVVDANCGFCCHYTTVNGRYEEEFNRVFDKSCRKYSGTYCSCFDLSSYPSCVNGKCQLVEWTPETQDRARPVTPPEAQQPEPLNPQPQYQPQPEIPTDFPSVPQTSPEPQPEPEPEPEPIPQQDLNAPFTDEPPPSTEDLYAPLPDSLPSQEGDLYKPLGGANSSSQQW